MSPRLTFVVTHPITADLLLRGQLRHLRGEGFDVTVIASPGPELERVAAREGVVTIGVEMSRSLRLWEGPRALLEMLRAVRASRPDLVNASTAKGGLLGMLASRALGVPARVYLVRGTLLETARGAARAALLATERMAFACATHVVFVSDSLRDVYRSLGILGAKPHSVIPSNGVDAQRFGPRAQTRRERERVRGELGIPEGAVVIGFVGRLVADKGVLELLNAARSVTQRNPKARFLIVGGDLAGDRLPEHLARRLENDPTMILAGKQSDVAPYYAAMDLLAFPSYREGLPNVVLEAAACELPAVGFRTTGVRDAIEHGKTGLVVPTRSADGLAAGLSRLADDAAEREAFGRAARERVLARFTSERVWDTWTELYQTLNRERRT